MDYWWDKSIVSMLKLPVLMTGDVKDYPCSYEIHNEMLRGKGHDVWEKEKMWWPLKIGEFGYRLLGSSLYCTWNFEKFC